MLTLGNTSTLFQEHRCRNNNEKYFFDKAIDGMSGELSSTETASLLALSAACLTVLINAWNSNGEPIYASMALSGLAFSMSFAVIRWTGDAFMKAGRKGKDMSKKVAIEMYVSMI